MVPTPFDALSFGLDDDADVLAAHRDRMAKRPRCGVADPSRQGALGATDCRWSINRLTIHADVRDAAGWSADQWLSIFREGTAAISAACGLRFDWVSDRDDANVLVIVAKIDRSGGVLADATMPCGAVYGAGNRLRVRMDWFEPWGINGRAYTVATFLHELCHIAGLQHSGSPESLMYPYVTDVFGIDAETQARLIALYGPPVAPQPVPPDPMAPLDILVKEPITMTTLGGRVVRVRTRS